jgi:hypothetical protein
MVQQIAADPLIPQKDNLLLVLCVQATWTPESVTGIVSSYSSGVCRGAVGPPFPRPASRLLTSLPDTPAITALLYFLALPLKTRRTSSSTIYSTTIPRTLPRTTSNRPCLRSRAGSLSSRSRPTPPCVLASREYLILSGGALGALLGAYDNIQQFYCGALL